MTAPAGQDEWSSLADDLDLVFDHLQDLADAFVASVRSGLDAYGRQDVAELRPRIVDGLERFGELAVGSGIVAVPGLLSDAEYWLEWWWRRSGAEPAALRVTLDPAAPDFFDYATDEWFAHPLQTGDPHVAGPYVDHACTNVSTFTLAVPAFDDGRPLGVVAMDVPSVHIERRVMPALCGLERASVLTSRDGRVIASSDPGHAPGSLVDLERRRKRSTLEPGAGVMQRLHALTGWRLIRPTAGP